MTATTLNVLDLQDWFLDKAGGFSLDLLSQNMELGIKLSDNWSRHTIFLFHAAKMAARWENEKQTSARGLRSHERDIAKDAVRRHLRNWSNKALALKAVPQPWCIPHTLAAFEMLSVRPPGKYVQYCQDKAFVSMKRCEKSHLLEWFTAGSALTLEFTPKFVQAMCERAIALAPTMRGYELYLLANKMAIMDAVTFARTGQKSPHLHQAFERIFSQPAIDKEVQAVRHKEEWRMMADARYWFNKDRREKLANESEQKSSLEYVVSEKFKAAGAVSMGSRTVRGGGHKIDLSFRFNDCNFDVEVDGPDHFIRCTDGHVITLNGSSIYQSLLMLEKKRDQKLVRLPYTIKDDHGTTPAVWSGLCQQIEVAPAGAYIVDSQGMLAANLLTQCSVRKAAPAPAKN
jgi:hypothetical protein